MGCCLHRSLFINFTAVKMKRATDEVFVPLASFFVS
jgi:hypothetical protein